MPGRPKKERKRQDGEKKKPPQGKLSKKGTAIRCRVCKGIGHNRTTCSRRTCSGNASGGASLSGNASGGASQSSNASGGASQSVRGGDGASQSGGGGSSKRKSCPSSTAASSKRHYNVSLTAYSMWSSLLVIYFLCLSYILPLSCRMSKKL